VPDVVGDHGAVVDLREDAAGFAAGCREVWGHDLGDRDRKLRPLLAARDWDRIAEQMGALIEDAAVEDVPESEESA
jgi:hypothetical protein